MTDEFAAEMGTADDYHTDGRWLGRWPEKMRSYLAAEADKADTIAVLRDIFTELYAEGGESMRELIRESDTSEAWIALGKDEQDG